ncbi:PRD domain-containing protein [Amedibacillus sp. YH-ame6]
MFQIKKVFNNNVVLVNDSKNLERILIGRGIAFKKNAGEYVDLDKIEKTYIVESSEITERFVQLANEVPINHLELVTKIVNDAEKELRYKFDQITYIGLADHINYALSRYKKGYKIQNALLHEIKRLYPSQFKAAMKALETIAYYESVELMEDEAGFIALHFVNGEQNGDIDYTMKITETLQKIILLLEDNLMLELNENSLNYQRFITHLRFFMKRISNETDRDDEFPEMYDLIIQSYPKATSCVNTIIEYLQETMHCQIYPEEKMYLILHVQRLIK